MYIGKYKGVLISVILMGIGGLLIVIVIEEFVVIGVDIFICVGFMGVIQFGIEIGDFIIVKVVVRFEGILKQYVRVEYFVVVDFEVIFVFIEVVESFGVRYYIGIMVLIDSFYFGQGRLGLNGYFLSFVRNFVDDFRQVCVMNFEMEVVIFYMFVNIYGFRVGCVCVVFVNRVINEFGKVGEKEVVLVVSEVVKIFVEWDEEKERVGKRVWYFGMRG